MAFINNTTIQKEIRELKSLFAAANEEILDSIETAKFLRISLSYLYKLVNKNHIPYYKPSGKKIYFKKLELILWLEKYRVKTVDELAKEYQSNKNEV